MKLSIERDVSTRTWAELVACTPHATFFHTPGWYAAHAASLGYQSTPLLCRLPGGRVALLPLATRPQFRGLVRVAYAGIEGGYGGLLSPDPLDREEIDAIYQAARARFGDLEVTGNPFAPADDLPSEVERAEDATQVVPLVPREQQLKQMESSRARKVKRGQKAGFELEVIHPVGPDDVGQFFGLYAKRAARWEDRRWVRDEAYFRALAAHAGKQLALFLAWKDGELAGFQLLGLQGRHVSAMVLATDEAHEPAQVGPFLAAEPMAWCHVRGYEHYDVLASGALESVKTYKASLGALTLPFARVRVAGWWSQALRAAWHLRPAA